MEKKRLSLIISIFLLLSSFANMSISVYAEDELEIIEEVTDIIIDENNGLTADDNEEQKSDLENIDVTDEGVEDTVSSDKENENKAAEIRSIGNQEELTSFMNDAVSENIKGVLTGDVVLNGYNPTQSFSGELDGNGHYLIIDGSYTGLTYKNIGTINNINITAEPVFYPTTSVESDILLTPACEFNTHLTQSNEVCCGIYYSLDRSPVSIPVVGFLGFIDQVIDFFE